MAESLGNSDIMAIEDGKCKWALLWIHKMRIILERRSCKKEDVILPLKLGILVFVSLLRVLPVFYICFSSELLRARARMVIFPHPYKMVTTIIQNYFVSLPWYWPNGRFTVSLELKINCYISKILDVWGLFFFFVKLGIFPRSVEVLALLHGPSLSCWIQVLETEGDANS